jgi:hypothetical protein
MAVCYEIQVTYAHGSVTEYVETHWLACVHHCHKGMAVNMIAIPILIYIVQCILI